MEGREKHQLSFGDDIRSPGNNKKRVPRSTFNAQGAKRKQKLDYDICDDLEAASFRVVTYQKIQLPKLDANSYHPFNQCFDFHFSCAVFQLFAAICHSSISLCIVQSSRVSLSIIQSSNKREC